MILQILHVLAVLVGAGVGVWHGLRDRKASSHSQDDNES